LRVRLVVSIPKYLLWALLSLLAFGVAVVSPQKVTTKVSVYNEIFLTDSGLIPLPDNAIELESELAIRSEHFKSPLKLALDPEGNVYVSSRDNNALCRFNARGEFLGQLGIKGEGKSILQGPSEIVIIDDQVVVYETPRKRLEIMNLEGVHLKSRKITEIEDFEIDAGGLLYTAPRVDDKDSPLIRVYSPDGKELAFGKPLSFLHSMPSLNSRSLAVNERGELFVAFRYFPIVRKYSSRGALLAEFRVESPIMEAKEKYNLRVIGEGIVDISQRAGFKPLIIDVGTVGDKVNLLSHNPRLEITELDGDGYPTATYWMDSREIYITNGFAVCYVEGEMRFYVAHSSPPEYDVDVLKKKRPASPGLGGEIERLTDEIAAYPDNSLAYNNRGAAKYRMGDFRGALEDFSKAIKLAPESAVAYNNRGLSRVKTEDFDGAESDFSKAIKLDPNVAAVYFNRGITRAHKNEFAIAIEDFETAAKLDPAFDTKAQEQIDYCRARLQKK